MPYSHVEMDGSNTTDNDLDNEILLIRKDENLCVFGERDELSVFMFCMGNSGCWISVNGKVSRNDQFIQPHRESVREWSHRSVLMCLRSHAFING